VVAAGEALAAGDAAAAAEMYAALAREFPERVDVVAGYARALLALGQVDGAEQALAALPADAADPAVQQARAQLEMCIRDSACSAPSTCPSARSARGPDPR
jgi:putative thioredoxin